MDDVVRMQINGYRTNKPVFTLIDKEDYEKVRHWKWQQGNKGYARRNVQITQNDGTKVWKTLQLHRVVLGVEWESDSRYCVDHINGDVLDNRKTNLRVVTLAVNSANRHIALSTSGIVGVSECRGRYMARVRKDGVPMYLGSYDSAIEAQYALSFFRETGLQPKELKTSHPVEQYDREGNLLGKFVSNAEAERQTGVCATNISRCATGQRQSAGGFVWRYVI